MDDSVLVDFILARFNFCQSSGCGLCLTVVIVCTYLITIEAEKLIDEYSFKDLPKSRYDFAILKNNDIIRLIEFDGEQHFMEIPAWGKLETTQKRDKVKNDYALTHNIPLVRIPYWERDNITLDMIMGDQYLIK